MQHNRRFAEPNVYKTVFETTGAKQCEKKDKHNCL